MRALLMGLALLAGGAAEAATFSYEYRGQPLSCDPSMDPCDLGITDPVPGWTGFLAIDEDRLPGGRLANSVVSVTLDQEGLYTTQVRSGETTVIETEAPTLPAFLTFTGELRSIFLDFTVDANDYSWSFGPDRRVIAWGGSSACGGDCDASSSPFGDGYPLDGTASAGPGEWVPVAPVPLPATAPALLAGLGALAVAAARRRSRSG